MSNDDYIKNTYGFQDENIIIDKKPLLDDMEEYNIDSGVNKIRISYSKYLG